MTATRSPAAAGPAAPARRTDAEGSLTRKAFILRWASVAVLIGIWQLALSGSADTSSYFATPSQIVTAGVPYLGSSAALGGLGTTAQEFLIAFAIAAVIGVGAGTLLGLSRHVAPVAGDAVYLLYILPQVPFYPLFILGLGAGRSAEIAFGVSHGTLPVILGTLAATSRVDQALLTAAESMGAGRWLKIRAVVLPAIVPEIATALRIGASLTLIGVVVAQILVSIDGVGGLIGQLAGSLQAARLDAVVVAVCVTAVILNVALRAGERRLSRWRTLSQPPRAPGAMLPADSRRLLRSGDQAPGCAPPRR